MPSMIQNALLAAMAGAASVAAHGYATGIYVDGKFEPGFVAVDYPFMKNPPKVFGWTTSATDKGFVSPDAYQSRDIACHKGSKNAPLTVTVAAGSTITVEWDTWPPGHKGPVADYLASCGSSGCESVDVTDLDFFKIDEAGLLSDGRWASEKLRDDELKWDVTIPADIVPGNYVLRHEIIALHSGQEENGAQNYPQCFNLEITGSGTEVPEGVKATELYTAEEEGIHFDIYNKPKTYPIPGPAVFTSRGSSGTNPQPPSDDDDDEDGDDSSSSSSAPAPTSTRAPNPASGTGATRPTPTSSRGGGSGNGKGRGKGKGRGGNGGATATATSSGAAATSTKDCNKRKVRRGAAAARV